MPKRYVIMRVPLKAYENFRIKQKNMEQTVKKITQKNISIPLTKVLTVISEKPVFIEDKHLIKLPFKIKKIIKQ